MLAPVETDMGGSKWCVRRALNYDLENRFCDTSVSIYS